MNGMAHNHMDSAPHVDAPGDRIEWEDTMPEMNLMANRSNMAWRIVDTATQAVNNANRTRGNGSWLGGPTIPGASRAAAHLGACGPTPPRGSIRHRQGRVDPPQSATPGLHAHRRRAPAFLGTNGLPRSAG